MHAVILSERWVNCNPPLPPMAQLLTLTAGAFHSSASNIKNICTNLWHFDANMKRFWNANKNYSTYFEGNVVWIFQVPNVFVRKSSLGKYTQYSSRKYLFYFSKNPDSEVSRHICWLDNPRIRSAGQRKFPETAHKLLTPSLHYTQTYFQKGEFHSFHFKVSFWTIYLDHNRTHKI